MIEQTLIGLLQDKLLSNLKPILGNECVLLGLPYYFNIGDVLIWEGTMHLLKSVGCNCIKASSKETFDFSEIPSDVDILLMGGGNFGDLWEAEHIFRTNVIKAYPTNKIIILPQTVFYTDMSHAVADAEVYSTHKSLYIFARDLESFGMLETYFYRNNISMLPDMAFSINPVWIRKFMLKQEEKTLFLKRHDKELANNTNYQIDTKLPIDIRDWPCIDNDIPFLIHQLKVMLEKKILPNQLMDNVFSLFFRPYMVKLGVRFLSKYTEIYTTRLHACILSVILEKPCTLFDNSYGKNRNFFNTWLHDLDSCTFQ